MSVGGTIAAACAFALLLALFFGCLARRSFKKFEREAELNAPLINSDDRRLDAALRDAEEGYNKCTVCEFENFKRFQFCTICGEKIVEGDQHGSEDTKKKKKFLISSVFKREKHEKNKSSISTAKHSSRRNIRAQRRKEWMRKVDVEGRAYWFRDSRFIKTDVLPAAFVVSFGPASTGSNLVGQSSESYNVASEVALHDKTQVTESKSVAPTDSLNEDSDPSRPSIVDPSPEIEHVSGHFQRKSTFGSVEKCKTNLMNGVQELKAVLIPVSDTRVDASSLPLRVRSGSSASPGGMEVAFAESMSFASKDFPSKYAHFVMTASSLLVPAEREHLRLNLERATVFQDSMESLALIPLRNLRSVIRINFMDESGIDAGGIQREWFVMLNEMLVDPAQGLFVCANQGEQTYFLSPCTDPDELPHQLLHLSAAGRLLGRALLEGSMLCFHLAPPLSKLVLGYPLSFADLEDFDPEVYSNLRWLLENDDAEALGLDFSVTVKDGESHRTIELVPGGSDIFVTDSNKHEYVERRWQYLLVESVAPQLQVFLQGLYEVIPRELLLLFDPEEFDFLLCGSEEIDVDDWEQHTMHSDGLHHHRSLKWFWELVREMPNEYRRRLLQFATGSSRVPLGGFAALTSYDGRLCPFSLKSVPLVGDGFIHSHACFNRLDLPLHVVREELKAVLYAILETEVYGFTTV